MAGAAWDSNDERVVGERVVGLRGGSPAHWPSPTHSPSGLVKGITSRLCIASECMKSSVTVLHMTNSRIPPQYTLSFVLHVQV